MFGSIGNTMQKGANFVGNGIQQGANYAGNAAYQMAKASGNMIQSACNFSGNDVEKAAEAAEEEVADRLCEHFHKKGKKMAKQQMKKVIKKVLKKTLIKFMGKSAIKKIPVAGIAAGSVFAAEKAIQGDWGSAGGEFASGTVSMIPVAGMGASMAIDLGLLANEINKQVGNEIN